MKRTISPSRTTELRALLGARNAAILLPRFRAAVADYLIGQANSAKEQAANRERAKQRSRAAGRLNSQVRRLLTELDRTVKLLADPATWTVSAAGGMTLGDLLQPDITLRELDAFTATFRPSAERLLRSARSTQDAAARVLKRKRGRKIGDRRFLAEWTAIQLQSVGCAVSANPDGAFARVLTILYDAAGAPAPQDLYRDLRVALAHVRNMH